MGGQQIPWSLSCALSPVCSPNSRFMVSSSCWSEFEQVSAEPRSEESSRSALRFGPESALLTMLLCLSVCLLHVHDDGGGGCTVTYPDRINLFRKATNQILYSPSVEVFQQYSGRRMKSCSYTPTCIINWRIAASSMNKQWPCCCGDLL